MSNFSLLGLAHNFNLWSNSGHTQALTVQPRGVCEHVRVSRGVANSHGQWARKDSRESVPFSTSMSNTSSELVYLLLVSTVQEQYQGHVKTLAGRTDRHGATTTPTPRKYISRTECPHESHFFTSVFEYDPGILRGAPETVWSYNHGKITSVHFGNLDHLRAGKDLKHTAPVKRPQLTN
uniref:Uncharacterized protein n=1 Tax=Timema poppense TaxID=170557 RepID=A0A7R9D7S0_TIMPO|nr:unnamed protein product [Timema poppensis]